MEPNERLVIKRGTGRRDVARAIFFLNWDLMEIHPADEDQPYEAICRPGELDAWVHYIEDTVLGLSYLVATGPDRCIAIDEIRSKIPSYSLEDRRVRGETPEQAKLSLALVAAAVGENVLDLYDAETVLWGMRHPDSSVRRQAILAVGYLNKLGFENSLRTLQQGDPDPEVREDAAVMLELLHTQNDSADGVMSP